MTIDFTFVPPPPLPRHLRRCDPSGSVSPGSASTSSTHDNDQETTMTATARTQRWTRSATLLNIPAAARKTSWIPVPGYRPSGRRP